MGTTVGGEQEAPTARYSSAGDDEAPSVGLRTARVARSSKAPAHAWWLPASKARPTCLPCSYL